MKKMDEDIRAVRDIREKISSECGNDPEKLVEHYMEEQERYHHRLLQPVGDQHDAGDASPEDEAVRGSGAG
jgi:uridine kinase